MKILSIVGARPQFIKAFPVSEALKRHGHEEYLLHTGQHYDFRMSQVFFQELKIPAPDLNLEVGSGSHAEQTARMLTGVEAAILSEKPDAVLVYGDTNSTLAGALAAVKLHVPVIHVEAGLRSFNMRMPEEVNRIVADNLSALLLAPTETAERNLIREGKSPENVVRVGDVMLDAALLAGRNLDGSGLLTKLELREKDFVLATIHRAENTDSPEKLATIVEGLERIGADIPVILPIHPRTRSALERDGLSSNLRHLRVIEPVGYIDMLKLEKDAKVIVTDSGGVQKEAYFQRTPCVTVRDETEWVELVDLGWNTLCPPVTSEAIYDAVQAMNSHDPKEGEPFGVGDAADQTAALLNRLPELQARMHKRFAETLN